MSDADNASSLLPEEATLTDPSPHKNESLFIQNDSFSFSKIEYIKLIMRSLSDMGFKDSVASIQRETGINLVEEEHISLTQLVQDGNFKAAQSHLNALVIPDDVKQRGCNLIMEYEFVELIRADNIDAACEYLMTKMKDAESERKKALTLCLLCPSAEYLHRALQQMNIPSSREQLSEDILKLFPSEKVVPSGRLETLVFQAMAFQATRCPQYVFNKDYIQNDSSEKKLTNILSSNQDFSHKRCLPHTEAFYHSLLFDIENIDMKKSIPTKQIGIINYHRSEIWAICFSPSGDRVVTSSSDGELCLWDASVFKRNETNMLSTSTMVPTMLQSIKVGAVVGASNELGCAIHSLDWSNCENLVVGCSDSQNKNSGVYIWSVNSKSMELLRFCNHHEGGICSAKFMIPPVAVISSHLGSIDPTSLTAMWSRRLIASVGADDKNIKIFDAETGISLSVMEERHGIVDFQPVAPSRYQGNLNSEENATKYVEREYGKLIYASDDMKLKLCSIELCQTRKGTSALSNKNTNGNLELYYYRITTVMNMQFQHHIVSIGKDICHSLQLLPESVFDFIISFATNGGLKMITVKDNKLYLKYAYELSNLSANQERCVVRASIGNQIIQQQDSFRKHDIWSCMVASGREDGTILLWRRDEKKSISCLKGHTGCVTDLSWSPTVPRLLVSVSDDHSIRFWY